MTEKNRKERSIKNKNKECYVSQYCNYPVQTKFNKFASAAHPKPCGRIATVITLVPYTKALESQLLCINHSIEIAVWKLAMRTRVDYSESEKSKLISIFGTEIEQLWAKKPQNLFNFVIL